MLNNYIKFTSETDITANDDKIGMDNSRINENQARLRLLKDLSKEHIIEIVRKELIRGKHDNDIWGGLIRKFVLQAVDSVKPSSRYLKDDMDFNKYVDIELLDYKDNSKSQYVNGCVLMKNLADRRMLHNIDNPKILLLKGSLGFMREFEDHTNHNSKNKVQQELYIDINSAIDQEDHYVQILQDKIK